MRANLVVITAPLGDRGPGRNCFSSCPPCSWLAASGYLSLVRLAGSRSIGKAKISFLSLGTRDYLFQYA